jgi:fatty acid desaturase
VTLRPISYYARLIRPKLPSHVFEPVPTRLLWLTMYAALAGSGIYALVRGAGGLWAAPLWSLLVGHSFAGAAFVGHETLHGAVVRNKTARQLIGWLCFLPFCLSPTLWNAWHNKVHHGHTGLDGTDPDAFPYRAQWERSRTTRAADFFIVARNRWAGFLTLLFGFTGQVLQMLLVWSKNTDSLDRSDRRRMVMETVVDWAFWIGFGVLVGPRVFVFGFVIPLLIGNLVVISYILTNHSLSPLTDVNDALVNSLTVEVPAVVNLLHLNFGLHTEHHLFPSMSSAYAPEVRAVLRADFPDRYQSMPFFSAMLRLWQTPRVYETATTLVDPLTGYQAQTLIPRDAGDAAADEPRVAA